MCCVCYLFAALPGCAVRVYPSIYPARPRLVVVVSVLIVHIHPTSRERYKRCGHKLLYRAECVCFFFSRRQKNMHPIDDDDTDRVISRCTEEAVYRAIPTGIKYLHGVESMRTLSVGSLCIMG